MANMKKKIRYPYEYDPKKRKLAREYMKWKIVKAIINGEILPIIFFALVLSTSFSIWLRDFSAGFGEALIIHVPVYAFIFSSLLVLVRLPINFYSNYTYEHKYGLSAHTIRSWFRDFLKELAFMYVIFILVITGLYYIIQSFAAWWLVAGAVFFIVSVFYHTIFPVFIFPLFYKTEPFRDEYHKRRLLDMAREANAKDIKNVMVAKESEKSVKANAMFAGLGHTKTIVLFDTLLDQFTPDEVETVVAHELGHYVNKDIWRFIAIEAVKIFPVLFIIDALMRQSIGAFGISAIFDIATLPLFLLFYHIIEFLLLPFINWYSRKREMAADTFALDISRKPVASISTEKRLTDVSLGYHSPPRLLELVYYTHPATQKRIRNVEEWVKEKKFRSNKK